MPRIKVYEGSHGTTVTRAKAIKDEGFKMGKGRGGTGIYFWAKDQRFYLELSKYWWIDCTKKGCYTSDAEPECAIIIVTIKIPKNEILDCEKTNIKNALVRICEEKGINPRNKDKICDIYDLLISEIEIAWKRRFNMIIIRVQPPESFSKYPGSLIGVPWAYVIRKNSYIRINDILNETGDTIT